MATYLHPGVYVEELPGGSKPIEAVGTSVAAFVGYTEKGPVGVPTLISTWDEYDKSFGGLAAITDANGLQDPMGHSVFAFFQNGGSKAYIVRTVSSAGTMPLKSSVGTYAPPATPSPATPSPATPSPATPSPATPATDPAAPDPATPLPATPATDPAAPDPATPSPATPATDPAAPDPATPSPATPATDPAAPAPTTAAPTTAAPATPTPATGIVTFTAANEGKWGDDLVVHISPKLLPGNDSAPTLFTIEIGTGTGTDFEALEKITDVSLDSTNAHYLEGSVDDGSRLVTAAVSDAPAVLGRLQTAFGKRTAKGVAYVEVKLSGGANGEHPKGTDYDDVFAKLVKVRDINILLLPGQYWSDDAASVGVVALTAAIAHCELVGSRMVIVDPPKNVELANENVVDDLALPTQTYCVLYYPWVKVANPFYDADTNPVADRTVLVAPSAFAAGMWAKIDGRRGVWKAPAGVETALLGVAGLEYTIDDADQDYLNPLGVNALRKLPSYGSVIWGARTLSTKASPEWRYIPVRRTAIFIEQSIYNGIQWAVFEPNDHRLWASLRANIESFMSGLFRSGAFQGEKAGDAFFVRCGLGSTMTQDDIDRGQVIVLIGFAPLKPAEFVIVRIQQSVGQQ